MDEPPKEPRKQDLLNEDENELINKDIAELNRMIEDLNNCIQHTSLGEDLLDMMEIDVDKNYTFHESDEINNLALMAIQNDFYQKKIKEIEKEKIRRYFLEIIGIPVVDEEKLERMYQNFKNQRETGTRDQFKEIDEELKKWGK